MLTRTEQEQVLELAQLMAVADEKWNKIIDTLNANELVDWYVVTERAPPDVSKPSDAECDIVRDYLKSRFVPTQKNN